MAYNIASLYAIKKDVQNTFDWLSIPLKHNYDYWIEFLQKEKDFKDIREMTEFNEFLRQFGQSTSTSVEAHGKKGND